MRSIEINHLFWVILKPSFTVFAVDQKVKLLIKETGMEKNSNVLAECETVDKETKKDGISGWRN